MERESRPSLLLVSDGDIDALADALARTDVTTEHADAPATSMAATSLAGLGDCVVLDCRDADFDVEAAVKHLVGADVPVVALADADHRSAAVDAVDAGASQHVDVDTACEHPELLLNAAESALARRQAERTAAQRDALARTAADALEDPFFLYDDEGYLQYWNDRFREATGYDDEELADLHASELVDEEASDDYEGAIERVREEGSATFEVVLKRKDGERVTYEVSESAITCPEGAVTGVAGVSREISERRRKQRRLSALHEAGREMMAAGSDTDVSQVTLDALTDILDCDIVGVYRWDREEGVLAPEVVSEAAEELFDEIPTFTDGNGLVWDAFVDGETVVHEDLTEAEGLYNPETPVASELIVPVGREGVLIAGDTERRAFNELDVEFVELLAATTADAFERNARLRTLEEQEAELQDRNARLRTLDRINGIIRGVQRALVNATTRPEVERAVCDGLTAFEPYRFARVLDYDQVSGDVVTRATAGDDSEAVGRLQSADATPPGERAIETDDPVVLNDLLTAEGLGNSRRALLDAGFRAVAAVPLSYDGRAFGALELYADRPDGFADEELEVLAELGETVANAVDAAERREALLTGSETEVDLDVPTDTNDPLVGLASAADCTLRLDGLITRIDDDWLVYVAVSDGTAADLEAVVDDVPGVRRLNVVGDGGLVGVVADALPIAESVADGDGELAALEVTPSGGRVTVRVPYSGNVRSFVEEYREAVPGASLVRQTQTRGEDSADLRRSVTENLTERQLEVLKLALHQGYFAWPREHSGEEVAEELGVSPPTFHQHVRKGIGTVLDDLLED
ncbi:GAF domain-containing protein [Halarchaeum sp. P4]|uniref:GAF domain-containing protein n=1 Tax=Halarchaeum sp. P4 TaxID=3421639 RepID=UPI003EB7FAFC